MLRYYLHQDSCKGAEMYSYLRSKFTNSRPGPPCAVGQVDASLCFIAAHNSGPCGSHPEVAAAFTTLSGLAQRLDGRYVDDEGHRTGFEIRETAEGRWVPVRHQRPQFKTEQADGSTLSSCEHEEQSQIAAGRPVFRERYQNVPHLNYGGFYFGRILT